MVDDGIYTCTIFWHKFNHNHVKFSSVLQNDPVCVKTIIKSKAKVFVYTLLYILFHTQ